MSRIQVTPEISIPLGEVSFRYSRSSGAGGQNVNKVATRVTLNWPVAASNAIPGTVFERLKVLAGRRINSDGVLQITSQRYRNQGRNVADCVEKLRARVAAAATEPRKRRKTAVPALSKQKRLADKKKQAEKKLRRRPPAGDE
ncbi:MAG: alternative ribosome rescue aminoacyl-tRNA hydrolase ArfB [Gemmatimonadales bacterium]